MFWKFWKKEKQKQEVKKTEDDFTNILNGKVSNLKDNKTGQVTQSALQYGKRGRYLKLKDTDCALVFHQNGAINLMDGSLLK